MIRTEKGMKLSTDKSINYEVFDYLSEIIKANRERPHRHNDDRFKESMSLDWDGVRSYEEAEEMAIHGWSEKSRIDEFGKIFDLSSDKDEEKMVTFKNDIVGYAPIIPLVLQGIPTSMQNVAKKRVKSKIIHIVYNISTTCGTSSKEIFNAGLELFKAIIKLERQGYRVKITAMQEFSWYGRNEDEKTSDFILLNLKSEFKPLDISNMMFPLMHPAMFRVIGFAWYERSPVTAYRGGYGTNFMNGGTRAEMLEALKKILKTENIHYLSFRDIRDLNYNKIIEKLQKQKTKNS